MTKSYESLGELSEHELLEHLDQLVRRDRETTAQLLMAIAEIDERKLWAKHACSSMFVFCMRHYHMSEQVTAKRIWAARTARRFPVVLQMLASGELHLSAIHLLSKHLTSANHRKLLRRAAHKSSREVERLVAEIAPRPDVPSRIRALPIRSSATDKTGVPTPSDIPSDRPSNAPRGTTVECVDTRAPAPARLAAPLPHKQVTALAPRRFKIEITVDQETHDRLRSLEDLLSRQGTGRDPATIVSRAIQVLLEQTLKTKAALTDRAGNPHRTANHGNDTAAESERRSRSIPAAIRREVWLRDLGRCAFADERGRRCGASRNVEFHHKLPFGKGGRHELDNIELRCRAHNQYQADLDFGASFMRAKRAHAAEKMGTGTI